MWPAGDVAAASWPRVHTRYNMAFSTRCAQLTVMPRWPLPALTRTCCPGRHCRRTSALSGLLSKIFKKHFTTAEATTGRMACAGQASGCKDRALQYFDLDSLASLDKPVAVPVTGTIPAWLKGSLYRNGSGVYKMGGLAWKHAFDGFAVLHRWTIQDGAVSYLSMILDTDHYNKCVQVNRLTGISFGSSFPDPCKNIFSRFFSHFRREAPSDNTSVNIVEFGDRLFALTETNCINEVNPETLKKTNQVNIANYIAVHMGTAHPHQEKDGTMYYFGTNMKYSQAYNFVRIPPASHTQSPFAGAQLIGFIPSRWKMNISYTHSFGMTQNYFVHLEQPYVINFPKIATMRWRNSNVADCIRCYSHELIDLHIISKATGHRVPIQFKAPFGFVFHFVNCYEDSGFVVCDLSLYEHADAIRNLYLSAVSCDHSIGDMKACFVRFVLPLSLEGAKVGENLVTLPGTHATAVLRAGTKNVLDITYDKMFGDNLFELPRINYAFNGQKYRYAYGSTVYRRSSPMLMKVDLQERQVHQWKCDESHVVGEPVFVPAPAPKSEDDGVILCPVLANTTDHSSFLLVLDAASFTEIARAATPAALKMNVTFHGTFVNKVF